MSNMSNYGFDYSNTWEVFFSNFIYKYFLCYLVPFMYFYYGLNYSHEDFMSHQHTGLRPKLYKIFHQKRRWMKRRGD